MRLGRVYKTERKSCVVVFSENYAKVLMNPKGLRFYKGRSNAVCNPNIAPLLPVPMQYWKNVEGRIEIMTPLERKLRDIDIDFNGIDRDFDPGMKHRTTKMELIVQSSIIINILGALYTLSKFIYG